MKLFYDYVSILLFSSLQLQQQSAARMPVIKPGYTTINRYHEMKQRTLDPRFRKVHIYFDEVHVLSMLTSLHINKPLLIFIHTNISLLISNLLHLA